MIKETAFKFDNVPCTDYGLMIYYLDDEDIRSVELGTNVSVIEDRLSKRIDPIHYGVNMNESLSFPLTFGSRETLTEAQVEEILSWLTGHKQYKWLELYESKDLCESTSAQLNYTNTFKTTEDSGTVTIGSVPAPGATLTVTFDMEFYDYPNDHKSLTINVQTPLMGNTIARRDASIEWDDELGTEMPAGSVSAGVISRFNDKNFDYEIETTGVDLKEATITIQWEQSFCVRYKCHINDVSVKYVNELPFAFEATIECDGQFGYVYPPIKYMYIINDEEVDDIFQNYSSYNGYVYPDISITIDGDCNKFSISNITDGGRKFEIDVTNASFSLNDFTINIDCQNGIIHATHPTRGMTNLYPYFNKKFLRFLKGDNELTFKADGGTSTVYITCVWRRKVSV